MHNTDDEALASFGAPPGSEILLPADVAEAIGFAMTRRDHASVNSILLEPRQYPI